MENIQRSFTLADQERFARLSGDRNPMHMDAVAARRTIAGAPAIHGMHLLLWTLDTLAARFGQMSTLQSVDASFQKFVTINDVAEIRLNHRDDDGLAVEICVDGILCTTVSLHFGALTGAGFSLQASQPTAYGSPLALDITDMMNRSETLSFAAPTSLAERLFPHFAKVWGSQRTVALATTSAMVGMACPGLHSIFSRISVAAVTEEDGRGLHYAVTKVDTRFRRIDMKFAGGGIAGAAMALARVPPVPQPAMIDIQSRITGEEFKDQIALVIGGSRGLGETTAKCLAAGGAAVTITYVTGRADAERVRDEIGACGGTCEIMAYDVAAPTPCDLPADISHCYYFATSRIGRPKRGLFDPARLSEFLGIYVNGFHAIAEILVARSGRGITLFYPSTIYVSDHPLDMAEYAMAKAAGEILCADMARQNRKLRIIVSRLPRLPTDQTASILPVRLPSTLETLLPILREMQEKD